MIPQIADMEAEMAEAALLVTLPWPDKRLTPNAKRRKHWTVYRPAGNADRETGRYLTADAMNRAGVPRARFAGTERIALTITFYPPDRRRRDDDGMVGAFKHLRDGMALAMGVDDHRFRPSYIIAEPAKPGKVEVTIL